MSPHGSASRFPWSLSAPRSLRAQVLVYGVLLVIAVGALVAWLSFRMADTAARRELQGQMFQTAAVVRAAVEHTEPGQTQRFLDAFPRALDEAGVYQIFVTDSDGRVVASTARTVIGRHLEDVAGHPGANLRQVLAGQLPVVYGETRYRGVPTLELILPLYGNPADPARVTGLLFHATPYTAYADLLRRALFTYALIGGLLMAGLVLPLALFLEHRVVRPVRRIVDADRALAEGKPEGMAIPADAVPDNEIGEIVRARHAMLERLDAAGAELRRRLRELAALNASASLLSQSLQVEGVLERVLDQVLAITGMEAAEVSLLDPDAGRLRIRAQRGFSPQWLAQESDRPSSCLCGQALDKEEPVCVEDAGSGDPRITRPACVNEGFRSLAIVPLRAEGRAIGVMSLHSRLPRQAPYSPQERDLLSAIGSQIGVALYNVRLYQEVQRLSVTDALTGLPNRRRLEERLQEELLRAQRYRHPLSVIMADIDHFKHYNDTHGHPQGDLVLREIAGLLRACVRETDLVARYGGEEFVVLLPETPKEAALPVAEKIRRAVAAHPFAHREAQPGGALTISLGVATFPEDLADALGVLRLADQALYQAKRSGRDRVCGASPPVGGTVTPTCGGPPGCSP